MKKFYIELTAGIFMLIGVICLAYLSVHLGGLDLGGAESYEVHATFADVGALRKGGEVVIAGVRVGSVREVRFNTEKYAGDVTMAIDAGVKLPEGTIAAIKTRGLIGEQYVAISPGGGEKDIEPGGRITETQSAVDLIELAAKYGFGDVGGDDDDDATDDEPADGKTKDKKDDLDDMGSI